MITDYDYEQSVERFTRDSYTESQKIKREKQKEDLIFSLGATDSQNVFVGKMHEIDLKRMEKLLNPENKPHEYSQDSLKEMKVELEDMKIKFTDDEEIQEQLNYVNGKIKTINIKDISDEMIFEVAESLKDMTDEELVELGKDIAKDLKNI